MRGAFRSVMLSGEGGGDSRLGRGGGRQSSASRDACRLVRCGGRDAVVVFHKHFVINAVHAIW